MILTYRRPGPPDTHAMTMVNNVTEMLNYVIAARPLPLNSVIADTIRSTTHHDDHLMSIGVRYTAWQLNGRAARDIRPICADVGSMPIEAWAVQIWMICTRLPARMSDRRPTPRAADRVGPCPQGANSRQPPG